MLKYIGKGAFIANIPARDLTEEEATQYGRRALIESGLYQESGADNTKRKRKAVAQSADRDSNGKDD